MHSEEKFTLTKKSRQINSLVKLLSRNESHSMEIAENLSHPFLAIKFLDTEIQDMYKHENPSEKR